MEINPEHIRQAEKLLIDGYRFDDERINFITNFETCDLLAVPGSGKTTALMAKLYCIDKQLPLKSNRGVLVLSHTNKAVEEIEKVLKPVCPKLFSYPNFVGTIQSFVNRFIANQACYETYGSYIRKNSDELFFYEVNKFYFNLPWSEKGVKNMKLKNKLFGLLNYGFNGTSEEKEDRIIDFLKYAKYDFKSGRIQNNSRTILSKTGKTKEYYNEVEDWKLSLYSQGILSYRDSFQIGFDFLKTPEGENCTKFLKKRFQCVFVDEMQDLDGDQIAIIESVFYNEENEYNNVIVIQRIGDKNQSIYSSSGSLVSKSIWVTRGEDNADLYGTDLSLQNSLRLSPKIAKLVDGFILERTNENYKVISGKEETVDLPPYLIVYDNENDAEKLESTFKDLIRENGLHKDQKNKSNGFHIIAWTTEKESNPDKWHLKKLFPSYSREKRSKKEDFDCLAKYLYNYDRDKKTFAAIRKSLLNGIIRVLRIAGIVYSKTQRPYRKSDFIKTVKNQGEKYYDQFKRKLFQWCFEIIINENYTCVFINYVAFINDGLKSIIIDFEPSKAYGFILGGGDPPWAKRGPEKEPAKKDDIPVRLSSVHGVKGQTHCATMYVETEYHNFETEKLFHRNTISNPLFFQGQERKPQNRKLFDVALKMMYVGFSRPTHLLCFAVKRENVEDHITKFEESGWKIIDLKEVCE